MKPLNKINIIGWNIDELNTALETTNGQDFANTIKTIINTCTDVETLKEAAIKFNNVREFFPLEDRLIEIMGEDEYFDFADEHDLA